MQKNIFKKYSNSGLNHKMLSLSRCNIVVFLMEDPFNPQCRVFTICWKGVKYIPANERHPVKNPPTFGHLGVKACLIFVEYIIDLFKMAIMLLKEGLTLHFSHPPRILGIPNWVALHTKCELVKTTLKCGSSMGQGSSEHDRTAEIYLFL